MPVLTLERTRNPASLAETATAPLAQLDDRPRPPLLTQLLARLHDIGVALDDAMLVERAHRE